MNGKIEALIFVAVPGSRLDNFEHIVKCAEQNAGEGVNVVHISERRVGAKTFVDTADAIDSEAASLMDRIRQYYDKIAMRRGRRFLTPMSTCKWVLCAKAAKMLGIRGPVMTPDWDFVIIDPVNDPYSKLPECDMTVHDSAADCFNPLHFKSADIIGRYVEFLKSVVDGNEEVGLHDMHLWHAFASRNMDIRRRFYNDLENGVYLDPNIHLDTDVFHSDREVLHAGLYAKRILWCSGKPFFIPRKSDKLVPVHQIHCWGAYKSKIKELCEAVTKA